MTTEAASETTVRPRTPSDLANSPALLVEVTNTTKIINDQLDDHKRMAVIGASLHRETVKKVISDFTAAGWKVTKKTDKTSREITLHFKEKRAGTAKKRTTKKTAVVPTAN